MSFGAVQSAMSSIKSNKSLLSKRKRLKDILVGKTNEKMIFKNSDVTNYQLKEIREKIRKENKRILIEQIIVFSLVVFYFIFIGYVFLF